MMGGRGVEDVGSIAQVYSMSKRILFWIVVLGGVAWLSAYFYILFFGQEKRPEIFDDEVVVRIGKHEFVAEVRDTPEERAEGLSGREALEEGWGMLFLFSEPEVQSFWMKDMKFPIDIIWIREGQVVGVEWNAPASLPTMPLSLLPLYTSPGPVDMVFEVSAGTAESLKIKTGDKFLLR